MCGSASTRWTAMIRQPISRPSCRRRPAESYFRSPGAPADAVRLSRRIDALERELGIEHGRTRIIALCTERPEALFTLNGYAGATARLFGLSWGAEDLSAAIGASTNRDAEGNWLPLYEMARSFCLLAAATAEVTALDTVFTDYPRSAGTATLCCKREARRLRRNAGDPSGAGRDHQCGVPADCRGNRAGRTNRCVVRGQSWRRHGWPGWQDDRPAASDPGAARLEACAAQTELKKTRKAEQHGK